LSYVIRLDYIGLLVRFTLKYVSLLLCWFPQLDAFCKAFLTPRAPAPFLPQFSCPLLLPDVLLHERDPSLMHSLLTMICVILCYISWRRFL